MSKTSDLFETYYKFNKFNENSPIIFVHGIGLDHKIWDQQINYFKKYNTIVYDLTGHGKTPLNKKQITISRLNGEIKIINLKEINTKIEKKISSLKKKMQLLKTIINY